MKIAFVVRAFPILSETFVINQITGLLDRGHEVDIFAQRPRKSALIHDDVYKYGLLKRTFFKPLLPKNKIKRLLRGISIARSNREHDPGVLFRSVNFLRFGRNAVNLNVFFSAAAFLGRGQYDIFHAHFGQNGMWAAEARKALGSKGKVVTTFHGSDVSEYFTIKDNAVYQNLYRDGDLFLPISDFWKERLIETGCPPEKIKVHRMGIDLNRFRFRERGPKNGKSVVALSIARLVEKKGIEYGIRALSKIAKGWPALKYRVVGGGPLYEELNQLVCDLGLSESVELLGPQTHEEVRKSLDEASLFMAPSITSATGDMEGIPVGIMEAMAMGLPVLSTRHSGIPELVEDGKSGFLVPERDADALAQKLDVLLRNPSLWPEMGRAGRAYVEANYDIDKLNDRLVEIYRELSA
jgi:colanic acid/amylovoran biosynthesis glycosyltransferase